MLTDRARSGLLEAMRRTLPSGLAAALALSLVLASTAAAHAPARTFGVYVDPWNVADWAQRVGFAPQYVARFEAFSRTTPIDAFLRESERQGLRRVMVTWEPWRPVPAEAGRGSSSSARSRATATATSPRESRTPT